MRYCSRMEPGLSAASRNMRLCIAALSVFMCAFASAETVLWRGETAYVGVDGTLPPVAALSGGVSFEPGRFADVGYEKKPGGPKFKRPDVYKKADNGETPTVCKVTAAADATPGKYEFGSLSVTVVDRVLPPPAEWKYFLDLWQHPWAVARYFGVEPFSREHYAKMEPVWRSLASCGCKALTVTILDLPWNHQCYDAYYSMVGRVKNADGTWTFDYSLFDEYVEFGRKCGLGPDIACYTMCPWGYMASWKERGTEDGKLEDKREKLLPGSAKFEEYWGPFLEDFASHLKAKGWFEDAYMAMDERRPDDVRAIAKLIRTRAPGLKIAMAGNRKPSEFDGIDIDNYSQGLTHLTPGFLPELGPRSAKGFKTTVYVCCTAKHPNTFMESPDDEAFWLGAYPAMAGFEGFLRWAANSWPADPYKDASFKTKNWKAGDTFLVYPHGELSARIVALRAGIIAAEKLRILKEEEAGRGGSKTAEKTLQDIAGRYGYEAALKGEIDFAAFRREVEALAAGRPLPSGPSLTVMTWNIRNSANDRKSKDNNWTARREDFANLIERENPDVIGFQEVLPDQREWLEKRFPGYGFAGDGRNADRINGESSPVAWRKSRFSPVAKGTFWLSETPDVPGSKSWDAAFPRICTYVVLSDAATGKKFSFANTHTDHKSEEAREKGMLLVIQRMNDFAEGAPIVFVGDHNCLEYEKPAVAVSGILKDAMYLSEAVPEGPWRTFNFWHWKDREETIAEALARDVRDRSIPGSSSDSKRIDYIYVSPGTRVLRFKTAADPRPGMKLYPSDHFPSLAEIILK